MKACPRFEPERGSLRLQTSEIRRSTFVTASSSSSTDANCHQDLVGVS